MILANSRSLVKTHALIDLVASLHVANAVTGKDIRTVVMPSQEPNQIVDFAAAGIFLMSVYEGVGPGVWRVDPNTGAVSKVSNGAYVPAGVTWYSVVDPRDANPQRSSESGQPQPNRIDYRDSGGRTTT